MTSNLPAATVDESAPAPNTMTDADSRELVEAVAALKVTRSSPSAKTPFGKAINIEDAENLDSGYASIDTSQNVSPDNSKFTDAGAVVGDAKFIWPRPARKKISLKPFDKPIPKRTQIRFEDLRELHADNLNRLTRGLTRCRGILMSLKVLGEDETTAAPWVFIQCDKAIAGKVRRFFKQPSVLSDFKPGNPNVFNPTFEIYVHEMPPMALHGQLSSPTTLHTNPDTYPALEIFCELDQITSRASLCGSKISVVAGVQSRSATFGGIISIIPREGYPEHQMLGITAGHFLADEQYFQYLEDEEGVADDQDDERLFDDGQDFELDLSSFDNEPPLDSERDEMQNEASEEPGTLIGHVYKTSQENIQDLPNFDWALFTIENNSFYLPNMIAKHRVCRTHYPDTHRGDREVMLITASSGQLSGTLSSSWSYLMLAPGRSLARTNALMIANKKALYPGDSGAWVIDCSTNEVYGHVVASDAFGIAYVVPIDDIFNDIQRRVGVIPMLPPTPPQRVPPMVPNTSAFSVAGPSFQLYPSRPGSLDSPSFASFDPDRFQTSHIAHRDEKIPSPDSGYSTMESSPSVSPPSAKERYEDDLGFQTYTRFAQKQPIRADLMHDEFTHEGYDGAVAMQWTSTPLSRYEPAPNGSGSMFDEYLHESIREETVSEEVTPALPVDWETKTLPKLSSHDHDSGPSRKAGELSSKRDKRIFARLRDKFSK